MLTRILFKLLLFAFAETVAYSVILNSGNLVFFTLTSPPLWSIHVIFVRIALQSKLLGNSCNSRPSHIPAVDVASLQCIVSGLLSAALSV